MHFQVGAFGKLPFEPTSDEVVITNANKAVSITREDWNSFELSWNFQRHPFLESDTKRDIIESTFHRMAHQFEERVELILAIETENNKRLIRFYDLEGDVFPEVKKDDVTLWRANQSDDVRYFVSYIIGCTMGRYSLDKPGLIYAHSGNQGFDSSQYQTFPADDDGIIPITDDDWFPDDAANRVEVFIATAWPKEHLEENLKFIAESLGPNRNEQPRETIRRYLATGFFKHHLSMYKRRPIYWLFSSGKQRAFQCLVYLHRYNEGTLSRMRTEYVIPLQGKFASRIGQLDDDINAVTSTSHRKRLEKERDKLLKQQAELQTFDEKLRHYADRRISLDLDDGVKVNYAKFGDLLAEVKAVTGRTDGP
jgi:hypothetical protein